MRKLSIDPTIGADQELRFQAADGTSISVRFIYNVRSEFWNVDVTAGDLTLYGIKLVPGWPILKEFKALVPIVGDFLFLPVSSDARNYDFEYADIGTAWFLYWITDAEALAWEAARGLE